MTHALQHPVEVPSTTAPLEQWLAWLETIHPVSIDMGLERVSQVADRLGLRAVDKPLILVGGTNGKGSTVAMLAAIYTAAGYRVGAYTSPHITDFRERICIDGRMAEAADIVAALAFVESQREPQSLTYFEYTTLAAMRVFMQAQCDVYVLEVGLGGRLDATNLWDADCSVVTSIALDHEAYLGSDVRIIATEKAAIGRRGRTLVVGDPAPPDSLFEYATRHGIIVDHVGKRPAEKLPVSALHGPHQRRNAACAVAVVETLQSMLPVADAIVQRALLDTRVAARFEQVSLDGVNVILDVAHNPAGAEALCRAWQETYGGQQAQLVFAALADKDIAGIVAALDAIADTWHCIALDVERAPTLTALAAAVRQSSGRSVIEHGSVAAAWQAARETAISLSQPVLVAGSFHTIAAVRELLDGHS